MTIMLASCSGVAYAPAAFATASWFSPPGATRAWVRAQLDDELDEDYLGLNELDRQAGGANPMQPCQRALICTRARPRAQLSLASQGRIRGRRSSLFDRRLSLDEIRQPRDGPFSQLTYEDTRLRRLPSTIGRVYNDFLNRPGQALVLGALSLLFGFYLAGSLSTIFGAAAFWEPVIALVPLAVTESISKAYYSREPWERSVTLKLCAAARRHAAMYALAHTESDGLWCRPGRFNAAKVGFYLGVAIDALKLAG